MGNLFSHKRKEKKFRRTQSVRDTSQPSNFTNRSSPNRHSIGHRPSAPKPSTMAAMTNKKNAQKQEPFHEFVQIWDGKSSKMISPDNAEVSNLVSRLTSQTKPAQPPSYEHHTTPILAIGNPGSGKSTILNSLAGELLFGSGISLGCGLTNQLDVKEANGRKFIDTPGVADDTYRKAAGEALQKVFYEGGPMKILFFITQEAGRIVSQDVTTMKLVLDSVSEIGGNYGIIVNKIPANVLSQLHSEGEDHKKLLTSISVGTEHKNTNVLLVPSNQELANINNALLLPSTIHKDLEEFIYTVVPEAHITPKTITKVRVEDFEELSKEIEILQTKIKKNKEMQNAEAEKLMDQFDKMNQQKEKEQEEERRQAKEELEKLTKGIKDKESEISGNRDGHYQQEMKKEIAKMKQEMNLTRLRLKMLEEKVEQQETANTNRWDKDWNLLKVFRKSYKRLTDNELF